MNTATAFSHVRIAEHVVNKEKKHSINVRRACTHKEVFGKLLDKLSVHYGVDMHKLVKL